MVQENYTALVGGMRQVQAVDLDLARAGVQVRPVGRLSLIQIFENKNIYIIIHSNSNLPL